MEARESLLPELKQKDRCSRPPGGSQWEAAPVDPWTRRPGESLLFRVRLHGTARAGSSPGSPSPPGLGAGDNRDVCRRERQLLKVLGNGRSQDRGRRAQLRFQVGDPPLQGGPL